MTFDPQNNESNAAALLLDPEATSSNAETTGVPVPFTMPTEQRYYWMYLWQLHERETLEGLNAGEYEDFDSDDPEDAARWLREPDEDE